METRGLSLPRRADLTHVWKRLHRDWLILPVSVLIHLAILLLLLRAAPIDPPRSFAPAGLGVALFDGRDMIAAVTPATRPMEKVEAKSLATQAAEKPPPPTDVIPLYKDSLPPVDPTAEPFTLDGEVAEAVASAASAAGGGEACDLTLWLQAALQGNVQMRAALAQIPRPARSVANAMMLWNGRWVQAPAAAEGGLMFIRSAVLAGVASAPEACRAEVMRGPVLLTLVDPSGSTLLAIGSGEWRWEDLLTDTSPGDIL